ncbi:MAG: flagellar protein FlaG [Synergistaceae bacterium]|nr:flagellar protein FlaG [Synergistaceae bacterium]
MKIDKFERNLRQENPPFVPEVLHPRRTSPQKTPAPGAGEDVAGIFSSQSHEKKRAILEKVCELMELTQTDLKYHVREGVNMVQVQVIDRSDGRVLRNIPTEETLGMVAYLIAHMKDRMDLKA